MKPTHKQPTLVTECVPYEGRDIRYQGAALDAYYVEMSIVPGTWEWVNTTCGTKCLNVEHMTLAAPTKLAYPSHVCIYCGRSAYTKDHLLPANWTGGSKRGFVAIVPACGSCNSRIGDTLTWSITERRAICHARIRRHYRKVLNAVEYGKSDLDQFGPLLRRAMVEGMEQKLAVMNMLAWPVIDGYDERACEIAGIDDPYAIGLLIDEREAQRIASEVVRTKAQKKADAKDLREARRAEFTRHKGRAS